MSAITSVSVAGWKDSRNDGAIQACVLSPPAGVLCIWLRIKLSWSTKWCAKRFATVVGPPESWGRTLPHLRPRRWLAIRNIALLSFEADSISCHDTQRASDVSWYIPSKLRQLVYINDTSAHQVYLIHFLIWWCQICHRWVRSWYLLSVHTKDLSRSWPFTTRPDRRELFKTVFWPSRL